MKNSLGLKEIHKIADENKQLKKGEIKKITKKMSKKTKLELIAAANNIPTASQKSTLLKSVVQNVIPNGDNSQEMLTAVKTLPISDGLKNKIFSTHAQGAVRRMKSAVLSKIPNSIKNKLSLVLSMSAEILNLCTTAMQDMKDLGLIGTMFFFYNEVLQKRPWLIGGINLNNYVFLLCGIYIFVLLLKLLRTSNTLNRKEDKRINRAVRMIPFFNETFLSFKIIRGTVKLFNMRETIATSLEKRDPQLEDEERVWENIADTSDQINQTEAELEKRKQARMRVKICSVLGDIMQASVLAILLLRSDLRVRGALISLRKMNIVGGKSDDGGTQGKLLTVLLTWLLLSPAFRLRKFFQGNKQGGLSPGGLALTLSFFFGLLRNVILSVALGYHSVFLCIVPQLLTALILLISKCIAHKEFRRWSLGDQVLYALIGSLIPSITPRSSAEDTSENDEDQDKSHQPRAHLTETLKTDEPPVTAKTPTEITATPMRVVTDAVPEDAAEPNKSDATPTHVETDTIEEDAAEPKKIDATPTHVETG